MNKKKIVIITSVIVLLILAILGASYAYYSATVKENNKTQTVIKTNELEIVYTGTEEINVSDIVPGDSFTKKFTVENTSNVPVTYNIYLENITNEFNEDLVYTLKDKDGTVIEEEVLPSTNTGKTYLITDIEIDSNELKEYEMAIKFKYSDKDQNKLQGKSFNATLGIDTDPVKIVKVVNDKIELDKLNSGDTVTKTFNVKNLSKETQSYDVILSDVVNTYGDNLTYSLSKNGSEVISNETMPSSDTTILESQIISANTTDEYVMTINFDNTTAALEYIIAAENDEFSAKIVTKSNELNYIGTVYDFEQKDEEQTFVVPETGIYKLETWGAQGGSYNETYYGGYGAYSTGYIKLEKGEELFINVGGTGSCAYGGGNHKNQTPGGYNGGGAATAFTGSTTTSNKSCSGGGATHIASKSGTLSTLEQYKGTYSEENGTYNSDTILIVSGGGGGSIYGANDTTVWASIGGAAGGVEGGLPVITSKDTTAKVYLYSANPATQSVPGDIFYDSYRTGTAPKYTNGAFGLGGTKCGPGGGAGWYGGSSYSYASGGSSFIGSSRLMSYNGLEKEMYCYECVESDKEQTKTISIKEASETPTAKQAKIKDGYAKITFMYKK